MNLVNINTNETITTLQLREMINGARAAAGEPAISNTHFIDKVRDELDFGDDSFFTIPHEQNLKLQSVAVISIEQATLVGMRESKSVRRAVLDVLKEMSAPKAPQTYIGALKALVIAEEAKEAALQLASQAIATKAEIGNRREATAMNTASQAVKQVNQLEIELDKSKEWSTIKRMEILHPTMKFNWRKLKSVSNALELDIHTVPDANYFEVKSYHAKAWFEAYGIEI
jgi:hypothetical protein